MGLFYNQTPEYAFENLQEAERIVAVTIRRRKIRAFRIRIHFYCANIALKKPLRLRELYNSPFDAQNLGLFKYVSTFTVRSLGSDLKSSRLLK